MSTSTPGPTTVDPKAAQIKAGLTAILSSSDNSATDRLQNLTLVHQARLTKLKRTATVLSKQPGADPAQVKNAEAAVTAASNTVAHIQVVGRQITTPAPKVSATGWALQGRVFDANLQPVPGFSAFLVDAQKAYLSQYGFCYIDATGYFLLTYNGTSSQKGGAQAGAAVSTDVQLFIEIANDKGQPVYISSTAFQPIVGASVYTNISLPDGGQPLGVPPKAARKTALPNLQKDT